MVSYELLEPGQTVTTIVSNWLSNGMTFFCIKVGYFAMSSHLSRCCKYDAQNRTEMLSSCKCRRFFSPLGSTGHHLFHLLCSLSNQQFHQVFQDSKRFLKSKTESDVIGKIKEDIFTAD